MSDLPPPYLLTAPISGGDSTIAHEILARVAEMRANNRMDFSLCWSPEELEQLAMFAIAAKNDLAPLSARVVQLEAQRVEEVAGWRDANQSAIDMAQRLSDQLAEVTSANIELDAENVAMRRELVELRDGDAVLQGHYAAALDSLAESPSETPAPAQCPRCRKWFRPDATKFNVSCTVAHDAGTCCHFSEIEIPAPITTHGFSPSGLPALEFSDFGGSAGDETPPAPNTLALTQIAEQLRARIRSLREPYDRPMSALDAEVYADNLGVLDNLASWIEQLSAAKPLTLNPKPPRADPLIEKMLHEFAFAYLEYIRDDSGLGVTNVCLKRARAAISSAFATLVEERDAADKRIAEMRAQLEAAK